MKKFIKYDYYLQIFFLILGPQAFILGGFSGLILFYLIIGIPQLISYFIRFFLSIKKTPFFYMYGILIIPVWVSVVLVIIFKMGNTITEIPSMIMMMACFYSPILALLYVDEYGKIYRSLK